MARKLWEITVEINTTRGEIGQESTEALLTHTAFVSNRI